MAETTYITARAPGKIILAGEHAVVYGAPALIMALDRFATASADRSPSERWELSLPDSGRGKFLAVKDILRRARDLQRRHRLFSDGKLLLKDVCADVADPVWATLGTMLAAVEKPPAGLHIRLHSGIPIGCGMGSSAALLAAAALAAGNASGLKPERREIARWIMAGEKLLHGKPSGGDAHACLQGGLLRFQRGRPEPLPAAPPALLLADSGRPLSGTGECVQTVARSHGERGPWGKFAEAEAAIENALLSGSETELLAAIRAQHRLLCGLGVVPLAVQAFVKLIESAGGAAKICGAGAVRGEKAGIIWVAGIERLPAGARRFGYRIMKIKGTSDGARIVEGNRPRQPDAAG